MVSAFTYFCIPLSKPNVLISWSSHVAKVSSDLIAKMQKRRLSIKETEFIAISNFLAKVNYISKQIYKVVMRNIYSISK